MSVPTSFQFSSSSNQQAANYTSGGFQRQGQQQPAPQQNVGAPTLQNRTRPASPLDPSYVWLDEPVADPDESTSLPDYLAQPLRVLSEQINAIKPPLSAQFDAIVAVFANLKGNDAEIKQVLTHYPKSALLTQCQSSLARLIASLSAAINDADPARRLKPSSLTKEQIQTLCQGLAVCVPVTGAKLFKYDSKAQLQRLTDTLLTGAMQQGLPEAMEANGEVFDILNWVSRGLKAGLLEPSEPIKRCFEQSLVLIDEWTRSDQSRQLLTGHNLGRCAVQISTILNYTEIDLAAASPVKLPPSPEQSKLGPEAQRALTYGELLQRCVRQMCAPAVLGRLTKASDETVSVSNIANTVKDAIDKRVLAVTDPKLLPALNELVKVIGTLPHGKLIGSDGSCRSLSNFSNFLRTLSKYADEGPVLLTQALPMLEASCGHLIGCINGSAFIEADPDSQSLTNLISFIKFCDKMLVRRREADSFIATTTASSATTTSTTITTTVTTLTQTALRNAAQRLTEGVLCYEASMFNNPAAQGGLLAGLTYLWQRNLMIVTSPMQQFVLSLLAEIGKSDKKWPDESRRTMLPALAALMALDLVTLEQAQPALQRLLRPAKNAMPVTLEEIGHEIKRLGVIEEKVSALSAASTETQATVSTTTAATTAATSATATTTTATSKTTTTTTVSKPPATLAQTQKKQETKPPITPTSNVNTTARPKTNSSVTSKQRRNEATKTTRPARVTAAFDDHSPPIVNTRPNTKVLPIPTPSDATHLSIQPASQPAITYAAQPKKNADIRLANKGTQQQAPSQTIKPKEEKKRTKNSVAKPNKGKATPGNRLAALSRAILDGQVNDMGQKLGQKATWSDKEIVTVLDGVMDEIYRIDTKSIKALDVFIDAVKDARQEAGMAILRRYFDSHQTSIKILQTWLAEQNLVTVKLSLKTIETQDQLLEYIDSLSESEWNDEEEKTKITNHWNNKISHLKDGLMTEVPDNRSRAFERLLQLPFRKDLIIQTSGCTSALSLLIEKGQIPLAKMLLATPEGVKQAHAINHRGENALMLATNNGHVDVVKMLLATPTGAEQTKAVNTDGLNALIIAAQNGHVEMVKLLLATPTGAEQTKAVNKYGANALMIAAHCNNVEILQLLLAMPTAAEQVKSVNNFGENPLMKATRDQRADIVRLLLATGSNVEQVNAIDYEFGVSALLIAAENGNIDIFKQLLAVPTGAAQAKTVDKDGKTALMAAAQSGHVDIFKMLLAMDFDGKQADALDYEYGINAMMLAAENGHFEIVKLLLATPTGHEQARKKSKDGNTALIFAFVSGHMEIAQLFQTIPELVAPNTPEEIADLLQLVIKEREKNAPRALGHSQSASYFG